MAILATTECKPNKYGQLIGNLIYLTITQPDLSYSDCLLSQFMQKQQNVHLDCAKRIFRYVNTTIDYDIMYKFDTILQLEGYTNVD